MIETNRYAEQYKNQRGNLFPFWSPVRSWIPVTENDIRVVFGLFLLMGIIQKPTARSYFSRKRVLLTPGFWDVIGREKFELICRFLHFVDNDKKCINKEGTMNYKQTAIHKKKCFQQYLNAEQNSTHD